MENRTHITPEEWTVLLGNGHPGKRGLAPELMAHISCCGTCRAFYEQARRMKQVLRQSSRTDRTGEKYDADSPEFQAVASASPLQPRQEEQTGSICVCIDTLSGHPVFVPSTLETEGTARKYALDFEENDTVLQDDEEELILRLEQDHLAVSFQDNGTRLSCRFLEEDSPAEVPAPDGSLSLPLPEAPFLTLELLFEETGA